MNKIELEKELLSHKATIVAMNGEIDALKVKLADAKHLSDDLVTANDVLGKYVRRIDSARSTIELVVDSRYPDHRISSMTSGFGDIYSTSAMIEEDGASVHVIEPEECMLLKLIHKQLGK